MIIKSYEIQKNKESFTKNNFFLLYGENQGLKKDIKKIIKNTIDQKKVELKFYLYTKMK